MARELNTGQVAGEEEEHEAIVDEVNDKRDLVDEITLDQAVNEFGAHVTSQFHSSNYTWAKRITKNDPSHASSDLVSSN